MVQHAFFCQATTVCTAQISTEFDTRVYPDGRLVLVVGCLYLNLNHVKLDFSLPPDHRRFSSSL
jgi:hypothetical protein